MITAPFLAALMAVQSPAASTPTLSAESRALLRCSAAFAMVAHGQENRNEAALKWPDLTTRGREFFVRSLAQLMDETGLDRAGISQLVAEQAQALWDAGEIEAVMPACLVMLDGAEI